MKKPEITVIMTVYNGEESISNAIDSILEQSFKTFEFIILDNASNDKSFEIIQSYTDLRITYYRSKEHISAANLLNTGLKLAQGEYIVIMGCDCMALPQRLEKQIGFMNINPDVGLCGNCLKDGLSEKDYIYKFLKCPEVLKCELLFGLQLLHSSVMFRKSILIPNNLSYNDFYENTADQQLWMRFSKYAKIANIEDSLIINNNLNVMNNHMKSSMLSRFLQLKSLGFSPTAEDLILHERICIENYEENHEFLKDVEIWFDKLICVNNRAKYYDINTLKGVLSRKYLHITKELAKKNVTTAGYTENSFLRMNFLSKEQMSYLIVKYLSKLKIYTALKRIKDSSG